MVINKPLYVDFSLIPYCNLNCGFCYASACGKLLNKKELSLEDIDRIFTELDTLEVLRVGFEGGEPFLRDDIIDIFKLADKHMFTYFVNTNGTLITEDIAKELSKTSVDKLCVSIDGPSSAINDASRGKKGAFELTKKGIDNLLKYRLVVEGVFTINKYNKDYVFETLQYMKNQGINSAVIMLLATVGAASKSMQKYYLTYKEWEEVLVNLTLKKAEGVIPLELSIVPPGEGHYSWELYLPLKNRGLLDYLDYWIPSNRKSTLSLDSYGCTAGKDNFCIDGYGDIYGCSMMVSNKNLKAGNILEESLEDIWNNSKIFKKLRNIKMDNVKGKCKQCDIMKVCKGGCRACAFAFHNDLNASDERCPIQEV